MQKAAQTPVVEGPASTQEACLQTPPLPFLALPLPAESPRRDDAPPPVPAVGLPCADQPPSQGAHTAPATFVEKDAASYASYTQELSTRLSAAPGGSLWPMHMPAPNKRFLRTAEVSPLVHAPSEVGLPEAVGHAASIHLVRLSTEDEASPLPDFSMGMRLPVPTQGRLNQAASSGDDDAASLALSDATSHRTQQGVQPRAMSSASMGSTLSLFRGASRGPLSPSTFRHSPSGHRSGGAAAQFSFPALVHSTSSGTMASGPGVRSPLASPQGGSVRSESRSPVHSSAQQEMVRPPVSLAARGVGLEVGAPPGSPPERGAAGSGVLAANLSIPPLLHGQRRDTGAFGHRWPP